MPREVLPGGIHIEGDYFPARTDIGTPHYAIHHSETYFQGSFSYNPSPWILEGDVTMESIDLA